jgi:hypothetical protein
MAKDKSSRRRDDLVRVRFLKRDAPWNQGDVEAFPQATAEKFVRQGVAELVKEE